MESIKTQLTAAIEQVFGVEHYEDGLSDSEISELNIEINLAPEGSGADYASNVALRLAKRLHLPPMEIAEQLANELKIPHFTTQVALPGFLNFISSDEYFISGLERVNRGEVFNKLANNISPDEYLNKTVIAEFSDPNPFKVLHVGHLYTSIIGDCLARLMELAGAKVIRANFGGDVGMHVAKNMYMILQRQAEVDELADLDLLASELGQKRAEFMADCYVAGTRAYEEDEKAHAEIVELNKQIYAIAEQRQNAPEQPATNQTAPESPTISIAGVSVPLSVVARIYWLCRQWSYDYFENFYARLGVKFDKYYPESTVAERGLTAVRQALQEGVYEKSDGAVVFKGEKVGLHTRVFINKEGLPTYEAKDVGLILTKWNDYHFDKSVIITGNDIVDYMKVVLASVAEFAPELPPRTLHLTHGNVKLAGGVKMSSRKGNFLKAVEVLDLASAALQKNYNSQDERVMLAAVKYAFLKNKMGGDSIFDPEESVNMTGNSGPYLQYATVRGKKILMSGVSVDAQLSLGARPVSPSSRVPGAHARRNSASPRDNRAPTTTAWQLNPYERKLAKLICTYEDKLKEVVSELAPQKLCVYLYELAQEFSRFYENVKVAGSEFEPERRELVAAYVKVMEHGLNLLGIAVPEEM